MQLLRRIKRFNTLIACLALFWTSGGQWVVLQSVAWAQMWVNFSRTESIAQATVRTFDGKHPCAMCKRISRAKSKEKKLDWTIVFQKLSITRPQHTRLLTVGHSKKPKFNLETLPRHSLCELAPPTPPPRSTSIS